MKITILCTSQIALNENYYTIKGELRQAVRQHVGDLIRKEPRAASKPAGVSTVTGRLPSPIHPPKTAATEPPAPGAEADAVILPLVRPSRYRLTLKGLKPCRL